NLTTTENCFQDQLTPSPPNVSYPYGDGYHQIISNDATELVYSTCYGGNGSDRTIKIFPQPTGYYSLEKINSYQNANDFITEGAPLTLIGSGYNGTVLSSFGQPASNSTQEFKNISVYPKPVEDQLVIDNEIAYKDSDQVKVYDLVRQEISISKRIEAHRMYLDVSHLSKGMYHIEFIVASRK